MSESPDSGGTARPPSLEKDADRPVPATPAAGPAADGGRVGRFWSVRRIPAGIAALLILIVAGLFLYDIAAVRAQHPAMAWRRELAAQLATRPLDDPWVRAGAGVAVLLGLWLLLLALTPGLRNLLPMRRTHPDVRAALQRPAAAQVLRDRAMEVSGVRSVRVRVGRRRAEVRAVSHFRDLDEVRDDLAVTLDEAVQGLGLVRRPKLAMRVVRPGRKG